MNTNKISFENQNPDSINEFPTVFNSNQRKTNLQNVEIQQNAIKMKSKNLKNPTKPNENSFIMYFSSTKL